MEISWEDRRADLLKEMFGFNSLIDAVQGLLIGVSIATGEIWCTKDMETTLIIVNGTVGDFFSMTDAFGFEK